MHVLHVYDRSNGICLVSKAIGEKTNEIPAAQDALRLLQLRGVVVSFDALNTQKETVGVIHGGKGHCVGALKGNQHTFFSEAREYFPTAGSSR
jgi:predicted transposase YbfD/YdcC